MTEFIGQHVPRQGTAAFWSSTNPILGEGERGWETDTNFEKTGDGTTPWNLLPYNIGHGKTLVAADIPFQPTGTLAALNVQDAIAEAALEGGSGGGGGAVVSVNGMIGAVTLTAAHVGALALAVLPALAACLTVELTWDTVNEQWDMPAGLAALGLTPASFHRRWWIGPDEPIDLQLGDWSWWQIGDRITNTGP